MQRPLSTQPPRKEGSVLSRPQPLKPLPATYALELLHGTETKVADFDKNQMSYKMGEMKTHSMARGA